MGAPPKGSKPRWLIVLDLLQDMKDGDILTYATLGEALNLHPVSDRPTIATTVHRVGKRLEAEGGSALQGITNVGYRFVSSVDHLNVVRTERARAATTSRRNQSKASIAEVNRLIETLRRVLLTQATEIEMLSAHQDNTEERLAHLEQALTDRDIADDTT